MIGRRAAREAAEEDLLEGILREALCIRRRRQIAQWLLNGARWKGVVIGGMEATQDLDGGLGGFGKLSCVGTGHGAAELSLTHQSYHIFGELGIVTGELQATGSNSSRF